MCFKYIFIPNTMVFFTDLMYKWVLWIDKPGTNIHKNNWDQFLTKVDRFFKIEDFWNLFDNILLPSHFESNINVQLFKSKIEPKWEDFYNLEGGKWTLSISKQQELCTNDLWEKTLAALVNETFGNINTKYINGAVLNIKKNTFKISIWTRNFLNKNIQLKIGSLWKKIIKKFFYGKNLTLEYFPHTNRLFGKNLNI